MINEITDPNFNGFDGIYAGSKDGPLLPPSNIDLSALGKYMQDTGKTYEQLSKQEVEQFRFEHT